MRILVTGGAGYIGSVAVEELLRIGHSVVVLDNLSKGHRAAVLPGADLAIGEVGDRDALDRVFGTGPVDAVMHFAADSLVGESMKVPGKYFRSNLCEGLQLLDAMKAHGTSKIVFSSTAAVYGEPVSVPIRETDPSSPSNPYGASKLGFESALRWYREAYGIRSIRLRYFNAAGASELLGEDHDPETHLIPLILEVASGKREAVDIFGTDYETPDGTCIRDYVHVTDLAQAHILALGALDDGREGVYNLGNGEGYSVREVVDCACRVTGEEITAREVGRRPGDPAILVASSDRAVRELGWRPRQAEIDEIVRTAWQWHVAHPGGYGE
ncbi:MAG: UDP-glucose 4-epimerase GalE [Candidatus Eisenbacteria sp.]|nr:UDP-glucose 4-epimerase GalE [Candidatus Eisenbacteria bacterium]